MKILLRNLESEEDNDDVRISFMRTSGRIVGGMVVSVPEVTFTFEDNISFSITVNELDTVVALVKRYIKMQEQFGDDQ